MQLKPSQQYVIQRANLKLKSALESIDVRDSEKYSTNPSFKTYEYNLSHSRALARISSASDKQYFQGSSLNRKKTIKDKSESAQAPAQTLDQSFFAAKKYRAQLLRHAENIGKRKYIQDRGMSRRTKIKIKEKMLAVYAASNNNFTLCTLTMIGECPDTKGVKILNKFLTVLRQQYSKFNYVWVAERQQNGRIHFHMICDQRFDIAYINSLWVVQQFNAGVDNVEARMKLELQEGTTFKKLHRSGIDGQQKIQKYLNPVDVTNVKTIDGVSAYLTNYVTKNETKMCCQIWHCNRNVSQLFTKQLISKQQFKMAGNPKVNKIKCKTGRLYVNKTFVHQYGMINTIYNKRYFQRYLKELNLINSWILENDRKTKDQQITEGVKITFDRYTQILYGYDSRTGETKTASLKDHKTTSELLHFYQTNKN